MRAVRHDSELVAQARCGGHYLAGRVPHRTRTSDSHEGAIAHEWSTSAAVAGAGDPTRGQLRRLPAARSVAAAASPRRPLDASGNWAARAVLRRRRVGRPSFEWMGLHEGTGSRLRPAHCGASGERAQAPGGRLSPPGVVPAVHERARLRAVRTARRRRRRRPGVTPAPAPPPNRGRAASAGASIWGTAKIRLKRLIAPPRGRSGL